MDNNKLLSAQKLSKTNFNSDRQKFLEELNLLEIQARGKTGKPTPPAKQPRQTYAGEILLTTTAPLIQNATITQPPALYLLQEISSNGCVPPPPPPLHLHLPLALGTIKKKWNSVKVNNNDQSNEYIQRPKNKMTEIQISLAEELKKKLDEINNKNIDSKPLSIIYDNENEEIKVKTTEEELADECKNLENLLKELSIDINALNNNTIKEENKEQDKGLKPEQEIMISSELNCDNSKNNNTKEESVTSKTQKRVQFNLNNTKDRNNTPPKTIAKRKFTLRSLINGFSCIKPLKD